MLLYTAVSPDYCSIAWIIYEIHFSRRDRPARRRDDNVVAAAFHRFWAGSWYRARRRRNFFNATGLREMKFTIGNIISVGDQVVYHRDPARLISHARCDYRSAAADGSVSNQSPRWVTQSPRPRLHETDVWSLFARASEFHSSHKGKLCVPVVDELSKRHIELDCSKLVIVKTLPRAWSQRMHG